MRSVYKKVFAALDFLESDDMLMESMTRRQTCGGCPFIRRGGKMVLSDEKRTVPKK